MAVRTPPRPQLRRPLPDEAPAITPEERVAEEMPVWKAVLLLYSAIAIVLTVMMGLSFGIAWAVTGRAY